MRSLCVFCGSNLGSSPSYAAAGAQLGQALARRGIRLIYGGGRVGLMGVLADAVLAAGGEAYGVIPQALADREVAHGGLTRLHRVASMHERKALMADLSQAFLALPGGIGTLEELFEVWTWRQLGIHAKACALLNVAGYYDELLRFLDLMVERELLPATVRGALLVGTEIEDLLDRLATYRAAEPSPSLEPANR
jgi:uncharacterized protein (TIGR00730 family)